MASTKNATNNGSQKKKKTRSQGSPGSTTPRTKKGNQIQRPMRMSHSDVCLAKFLAAQFAPFTAEASGACIPGPVAPPSMKYSNTVKTVLSFAQNAGTICILFVPTPANNQLGIKYGQNGAAPTTVQYALSSGLGLYMSNGSPFAGSAFGTGSLEQRFVGGGVRIRLASNPLTTSGYTVSYGTGTDSGVPLGVTSSDAGIYFTSQIVSNAKLMTGDGMESYVVMDEADVYDQWFTTPNWRDTNPTISSPLAIFIGVDGTSTQLSVVIEAVSHWEVKGRTVAPSVTINHNDPQLFGKMTAAISDVIRFPGSYLMNSVSYVERVASLLEGYGQSASRVYAITSLALRSFRSARRPQRGPAAILDAD